MDPQWHEMLARLDYDGLVELRQAVDDVMSFRGWQNASYPPTLAEAGYNPVMNQPDYNPIMVSSLHASDRASSRAQSAYSGETMLYEPQFRQFEAVEDSSQSPAPHLRSSYLDDKPLPCPVPRTNRAARTHTRKGAAPRGGVDIQARWCTYCKEEGVDISFKTKHDWKRHETKFHETGRTYHCNMVGCSRVFTHERDIKQHYDKVHGTKDYPHIIPVPSAAKVVFACGFEGCRKLTYNWEDRCNHVARCMLENNATWNYTWKMRNLLRQDAIRTTWKTIRDQWCEKLQIDASTLSWSPATSRNIRQDLECQNFGSGPALEGFCRKVLKLGLLRGTTSFQPSREHSAPKASLDHTPADDYQIAPILFDPTFSQEALALNESNLEPRILQGITDTTPIPRSAFRNSIAMVDAPPLLESDSDATAAQETSTSDKELITIEEFIYSDLDSLHATPPVPPSAPFAMDNGDAPTGSSKTSPRRKLMRKSKEWLSQQFSQPSFDQPPPLPMANARPLSPRKYTALNASMYGMYHFPN